MQVIDALKGDSRLGANLAAPSISYGSVNLYMRGVLEAETAGNLQVPISQLVDGDGSLLQVWVQGEDRVIMKGMT